MYQIKCDEYVLYDPRDEALILINPKCKLEANTVGEGSFTILSTHPFYDKLYKLKSIFEIRQNEQVIFRGRMTNDSRDFHNRLDVDLEGALAFANDTVVPPFKFPEDFPEATAADNIVEYFLGWVLDQHNAHAEEWQELKLGRVTVSDPNNYITRSSSRYESTWETLKKKLFESALGGYLMIRYEEDGNYVDYLSSFELTNTQPITFGENLIDLKNESDATETYSAILPMGAESESADGTKTAVTLADLPDGDLTDDLVKEGLYIYSKSARREYGWKVVPVDESTWSDVTIASNLQTKAMNYLSGTAMLLSGTITIKAVDLGYTDEMIQSFRIGRNIIVNSPAHGVTGAVFQLNKLEIDVHNPQKTTITVGNTVRTLIDINRQQQVGAQDVKDIAVQEIQQTVSDVAEIQNTLAIQTTQIINACNEIILAALEEYVETSNFERYKETVSAQLQIMADEITMKFTAVTEQVNNVDGDLQAEITQRTKHISFSEDGITIGAGENAMQLRLDNDMIVFLKGGQQFGWWDGVDFHTGNIVVEVNERAQFGNFAFVPRSDGSLMFLKVGG